MTVTLTSAQTLYVAGTFNDWRTDDPACQMQHLDDGVWEVRVLLERGAHAFKFAVDGSWDINWGDDSPGPVIPPLQGQLSVEGANILLNIQLRGLYIIRVDVASATWEVLPRYVGPGPAGSIRERQNAAWFDDLQKALNTPSERDQRAAYENWVRTRLIPGDFDGQFPLGNGKEIVFLAHGPGPLSVAGTFNEWDVESTPMQPLQGTPLHYARVKLPAAPSHAYKFHREGEWLRDPWCRLVAWDGYDPGSPGDFNSLVPLQAADAEANGHLIWMGRFYSLFLDNERDIFVFLPPNYSGERERFPVLYVHDGNESLVRGRLHQVAERLMHSGSIDKCILVFIALPSQDRRYYEYADREGRHRYARFLVRELVPFIDSHFMSRTDASARGVIGVSYGGLHAFYTAYHFPHVFGRAGAQGGNFDLHDYEIVRLLAEGTNVPVQFYLDSSKEGETHHSDSSVQSQAMAQTLAYRGYRYLHYEAVDEGHDWPFWAGRFGHALRFFWPGQGKE